MITDLPPKNGSKC